MGFTNPVTLPVTADVALFGSGSDGAAVLDGAAAVSWATRAGNVYTQTADCQCTTLVVNNGITLATAGFRTQASESITNNGTIHNDGGAAVTIVAGAGAPTGTLNGGGAGGTQAAGSVNGNSQNPGFGGQGGHGGAKGVQPGGVGGLPLNGPVVPANPLGQFPVTNSGGGAGGAAGGNNGTGQAGSGGGGGGAMYVAAPTITNNGVLRSGGGIGGQGALNGGGGGGGGGGGFVCVAARTLTGAANISAPAGAAGPANGTAPAGSPGTAGHVALVTPQ